MSWLSAQPKTMEIQFDAASLRVGLSPGGRVEVLSRSGAALGELRTDPRWARTSWQAFFAEWFLFLEGIATGRPSLIAAVSAETTTAAVEAIYGGARS